MQIQFFDKSYPYDKKEKIDKYGLISELNRVEKTGVAPCTAYLIEQPIEYKLSTHVKLYDKSIIVFGEFLDLKACSPEYSYHKQALCFTAQFKVKNVSTDIIVAQPLPTPPLTSADDCNNSEFYKTDLSMFKGESKERIDNAINNLSPDNEHADFCYVGSYDSQNLLVNVSRVFHPPSLKICQNELVFNPLPKLARELEYKDKNGLWKRIIQHQIYRLPDVTALRYRLENGAYSQQLAILDRYGNHFKVLFDFVYENENGELVHLARGETMMFETNSFISSL